MKSQFICFTILVSMLFLGGCSDSSSQLVGAWKSVEERSTGTHDKLVTYIFTNDTMRGDARSPISIVFEEKNGEILVHRDSQKGPVILNVTILDKDRITIEPKGWFPRMEFIRSTHEEVDAIAKSEGREHKNKGWTAF